MSKDTLRRVLTEEAEAVRLLADSLDASFLRAVDLIEKCKGRVITCGVGKSGHVARKTAGTLASTGTPALFLHASEAVHGDLGMVTKNDVVLVYTFSGETDEVVRLFPSFKGIGAKTVLITGRIDSSAGREADVSLDIHVDREACPNNLAPTTSTTVMMALSDALAIAVMERRSFGRDEFAFLHPAGALGKRLTMRVSDVMRQGADLALVSPETPVVEVMHAITKAGAGGACVVDGSSALLGFITDGDLRRHFERGGDGNSSKASDLMSKSPATIGSDLLAFEALEMFQNYPHKIGEMPVVQDGKVVGLLMLKDLLRSGIV
ncbi:MAG TPA: KpsF/GutQ family sugar-phosphate isomerase [Fimbriimonadaceae bacterium]|nr:KpsF/GutQ family sugar-phosphate isomerase [Fimbriimonadaceae bacterium]